MPKVPKLTDIVIALFTVAALVTMAYYFHRNWSYLQNYKWLLDLKILLLSLALLWLAILSYIYAMFYIFKRLTKADLKFFQMYRIISITNIARYLPGKIWNVVGLFYYIKKYGITKRQTSLSIIACEVSSKGAATLIGICYFLFSSSFQNYLPLMLFLLVACLIVIHPRVLDKIINLALRLLKKEPITIDFSYSTIFIFFLMYIMVWEMHSLAFYVLVNSVTPLESVGFLKFSTILPLCWVVGYIVLLTPGGIGVREGMLVITLGEFLSPEVALAVAVLQRIWFIIVEGINVSISLAIPAKTDTR